jgi:hypothetical protein
MNGGHAPSVEEQARAQDGRPLTRQGVYRAVWAEPVHTVAARYGISDVGLAKLCRRHGIPLPGRGYWQQVRAGQKIRRPPLRVSHT